MRRKTPTILSNEWPDVASYLTETSGVFTRKSPEFRSAEPILIRLHPYATGCLDFRHGRTSKPSDFTHFNGRQGPAFTELTLLRPLRMHARWMPVEWQVENSFEVNYLRA